MLVCVNRPPLNHTNGWNLKSFVKFQSDSQGPILKGFSELILETSKQLPEYLGGEELGGSSLLYLTVSFSLSCRLLAATDLGYNLGCVRDNVMYQWLIVYSVNIWLVPLLPP